MRKKTPLKLWVSRDVLQMHKIFMNHNLFFCRNQKLVPIKFLIFSFISYSFSKQTLIHFQERRSLTLIFKSFSRKVCMQRNKRVKQDIVQLLLSVLNVVGPDLTAILKQAVESFAKVFHIFYRWIIYFSLTTFQPCPEADNNHDCWLHMNTFNIFGIKNFNHNSLSESTTLDRCGNKSGYLSTIIFP